MVVAYGLSRSLACGIFLDLGLNLCLLHWQADSATREASLSSFLGQIFFFFFFYFLKIFIFISLAAPALDYVTWTLQLLCAGSLIVCQIMLVFVLPIFFCLVVSITQIGMLKSILIL